MLAWVGPGFDRQQLFPAACGRVVTLGHVGAAVLCRKTQSDSVAFVGGRFR